MHISAWITRFSAGALALFGAAAAFGVFRGDAQAQDASEPLSSAPLFGDATVSGFVVDALSGRPVKGATIVTEPDFGSTPANQQGLYVLVAGNSYGVLTLRASAPGFRALNSACVLLRPGANGFGDIPLVRADTEPSDDCTPGCSADEVCLGGVCATSCEPSCPCTELCVAGACVANPDLPAHDSCGSNSKSLGGGVCGCNPGFVPNANGVACVAPNTEGTCPESATSTALGCQCTDGLVYSAESDSCLLPDEAAVVAPLGAGTIVASWRTPGARPSAIAYDGRTHWLADRGARSLYSLELTPGASDAKVLSTFDLGEPGSRVIDLAVVGTKIFILAQARDTLDKTLLLVFDPTKQELAALEPTEFQGVSALMSDGSTLYSVGRDGIQVRDASAAISGTTRSGNIAALAPSARPGTLDVTGPIAAGPAGGALTLNQFIVCGQTHYDSKRFIASCAVANAVNRNKLKGLGSVVVEIPGSHVMGFDAYGSTGWMVVAGVGVEHALISEVHFGAK